MIKLIRNGDSVKYEGQELRILQQKSKGPGQEYVILVGIPECDELRREYIKLSKLHEGLNEVVLTPKVDKVTTQKYALTDEEKAELAQLESRILEIKENAKKRYQSRPKFDFKVEDLSEAEKLEKIEQLKKFLGL